MFAIKTTATLFFLSFFAICCLHLLEHDAFLGPAILLQYGTLAWHGLYAIGLTAMSWLFFGMIYVLRFLASRIEFAPTNPTSGFEADELPLN